MLVFLLHIPISDDGGINLSWQLLLEASLKTNLILCQLCRCFCKVGVWLLWSAAQQHLSAGMVNLYRSNTRQHCCRGGHALRSLALTTTVAYTYFTKQLLLRRYLFSLVPAHDSAGKRNASFDVNLLTTHKEDIPLDSGWLGLQRASVECFLSSNICAVVTPVQNLYCPWICILLNNRLFALMNASGPVIQNWTSFAVLGMIHGGVWYWLSSAAEPSLAQTGSPLVTVGYLKKNN